MTCPLTLLVPSLAKRRRDLLVAAQRLRYEVYCQERRFVDAAECPDGLETDEYDRHAVHFVAVGSRGRVGGTLRLVRDSGVGFPLERRAGRGFSTLLGTRRRTTAELSRLVVSKTYRGRDVPSRLMLLGLLARMYEEARRVHIEGLFAAMEVSLWRLLRTQEIDFEPMSDPIQYWGTVVPYYADLDTLERGYKRIIELEESVAPAAKPGHRFFTVRLPPKEETAGACPRSRRI